MRRSPLEGPLRIHKRGAGDAADDFAGQFRAWYGPLWGRIATALGLEIKADPAAISQTAYRVEVVETQMEMPIVAAYSAYPMTVVANRELQTGRGEAGPERSTRHIELALPETVAYHAGDHLGVLPRNRDNAVGRVLDRFGLTGNAQVIIRRDDGGSSTLPLDSPIRIADLIAGYIELQEPATREQVRALAETAACPPDKVRLERFTADDSSSASGTEKRSSCPGFRSWICSTKTPRARCRLKSFWA